MLSLEETSQRHGKGFSAQRLDLLGRAGQRLFVDVTDDDIGAFPGHRQGDALAQPLRPAGDQGHFVFQLHG